MTGLWQKVENILPGDQIHFNGGFAKVLEVKETCNEDGECVIFINMLDLETNRTHNSTYFKGIEIFVFRGDNS